MNLVINASEAIGDRDGVIRVTTNKVTASQDVYLRMEVSNTGDGIPAETQARLFDPFFTTKSAGRGLGLAVVGGIVRGLRGTIHVVSEPGKGAAFQVLLPAAEPASGAAELAGANGTSAIAILRANGSRIDLILLDMTIPGLPAMRSRP
jgi:signal transduction histidine kinase